MESSFDLGICSFIDWLESKLFSSSSAPQQPPSDEKLPLVKQDNTTCSELLGLFELHALISLFFNSALFLVLTVHIPQNIMTCWSCSSILTTWLIALCAVSSSTILPKIILIRKLFQIEESTGEASYNYHLWSFFNSNALERTNKADHCGLVLYLAGFIYFNVMDNYEKDICEDLFGLVSFLLVCAVLLIFLTILKLICTFPWALCVEIIMHPIKKTFYEQLEALKVKKYREYKKESEGKVSNCCSICLKEYTKNSVLRIMNCKGSHVFHMECIDKWLSKSQKCPLCNLNVLGKLE